MKVTALLGVSMKAVLSASTGRSNKISWCFISTSLCLPGVEGGYKGGGSASPAPSLRVVEVLVGMAKGGLARVLKGLAREVSGLVVVTVASGEGQ